MNNPRELAAQRARQECGVPTSDGYTCANPRPCPVHATRVPPTGEREGARERLREALDGFIAVHVEDGVCGPESSAKAEGGPEWCGWCEDAREALALDATSPAAYCAPCGRALTEEEIMCVDCASDAAPAQPGEGEPSADEVWSALEAVVNSFTLPEEEAAHAAARALLERRGGKGLDGKRGR